MKRITVLSISLLILLFASFATSPNAVGLDIAKSSDMSIDMGLDQEEEISDSYYPIFDGVTVNTGTNEQIRSRNDTLGEGAIVQVDSYANITFNYVIALQNTSTLDNTIDLRLFADLTKVNETNFNNTFAPDLSLTDEARTLTMEYQNTNSTVLDYVHPKTGDVYENATLYDFQTTIPLNMSVSYLRFYAAEIVASPNIAETQDDGAYNLLTTDDYLNTTSQDEFYIQNEIVNITGNLYFNDASNVQAIGIDYRVNTGSQSIVNFTLAFDVNSATGSISLSDYTPGTVVSWDSVMFVGNDTLINQSRIISGVDSKNVEIGDGTPEITVEINPNDEKGLVKNNNVYSFNNEINYTVVATVPKGNITNVALNVNDTLDTTFNQVDNTFNDVELSENVTYAGEGVYETTIFATTDKGLNVSTTYTVFIDQTAGTIDYLRVKGSPTGPIVTSDGAVTFEFNFSDDLSGVRMAVLDLGNGISVGVEELSEFTYRYKNFNSRTYTFELTVIDFAGNEVSSTGTVTLEQSGIGETDAPSLGFYVFLVVFIALLTSFKWGPVVSEKLRNLF